MDSYETDDPGKTSKLFNDYFVKNWRSIAKKGKAMNDDADFKTLLNNSVSQSIVLELSQPIKFLTSLTQ